MWDELEENIVGKDGKLNLLYIQQIDITNDVKNRIKNILFKHLYNLDIYDRRLTTEGKELKSPNPLPSLLILLKIFSSIELFGYLNKFLLHTFQTAYNSKENTVERIIFDSMISENLILGKKKFLDSKYGRFLGEFGEIFIPPLQERFEKSYNNYIHYREMPMMYYVLLLSEIMGKTAIEEIKSIIKLNDLENITLLKSYLLKVENAPPETKEKEMIINFAYHGLDELFYISTREIAEGNYNPLIRLYKKAILKGLHSEDSEYNNATRLLLRKIIKSSINQVINIGHELVFQEVFYDYYDFYWKKKEGSLFQDILLPVLSAKKQKVVNWIINALENIRGEYNNLEFRVFLYVLLFKLRGEQFYNDLNIDTAKLTSRLLKKYISIENFINDDTFRRRFIKIESKKSLVFNEDNFKALDKF